MARRTRCPLDTLCSAFLAWNCLFNFLHPLLPVFFSLASCRMASHSVPFFSEQDLQSRSKWNKYLARKSSRLLKWSLPEQIFCALLYQKTFFSLFFHLESLLKAPFCILTLACMLNPQEWGGKCIGMCLSDHFWDNLMESQELLGIHFEDYCTRSSHHSQSLDPQNCPQRILSHLD